jgi:hypothetical protein
MAMCLCCFFRGKTAEHVVVQQYKHGFSGFAARLSGDEAASLRRKPGVVSVFADPVYQLHTTRSWEFLQETAVKIDSATRRSAAADAPTSPATVDTIIGLLDSGIWPESPSFDDTDFGPVPSRWKGACMDGDDFNSSNCNRFCFFVSYFHDLTCVSVHFS